MGLSGQGCGRAIHQGTTGEGRRLREPVLTGCLVCARHCARHHAKLFHLTLAMAGEADDLALFI